MSPDQAYIPPCATRPGDWDLDAISHRPDLIEAALHTCRACPMLDACRAMTETQQPLGVVQAGEVWPERTPGMTRTRCTTCKRPFRPARAPAGAYPGTVRNASKGRCDTCTRNATKATQAVAA